MEFGFQIYGKYQVVHDSARFAYEGGLAAVMMVDHLLMSEDMESKWDLPAPAADRRCPPGGGECWS